MKNFVKHNWYKLTVNANSKYRNMKIILSIFFLFFSFLEMDILN